MIVEQFAAFIPKRFRERVGRMLVYAGIPGTAEHWLGIRLVLSVLFGIGAYVILKLISDSKLLVLPPVALLAGAVFTFIAAMAIYLLHVYYLQEDRARRVENVLPDFLLLIAANIRAGQTPFSAFRAAARPEFGPLENEAQIAVARSLGTGSFSDALRELSKRIHSTLLERIVGLFAESMRSGGNLAQLLEISSTDIKQRQEIHDELIAQTRMYSVFIMFVLMVGTPMLLAISVQFVGMLQSVQAQQAESLLAQQAGISFLTTDVSITPQYLDQMAYIILLFTTFLGSCLMGVITTGKVRLGLKYFVPMAAIAILLYITGRLLIAQVISVITF